MLKKIKLADETESLVDPVAFVVAQRRFEMNTRDDIKWFDTFADLTESLIASVTALRQAVLTKDPGEQTLAYDAMIIQQQALVTQCELNTDLVGAKVGQAYFFEGERCTVIRLHELGPYRGVAIRSDSGSEMILNLRQFLSTAKLLSEEPLKEVTDQTSR